MLSLGKVLGQHKFAQSTGQKTPHYLISRSPKTSFTHSMAQCGNGLIPIIFENCMRLSKSIALRNGVFASRITQRYYARPRKTNTEPLESTTKKSSANTAPKKKLTTVEDDEILDTEFENYPELSQPFEDKDVPEELKEPMKEIALPRQKHVFNYKTYRYKDLQLSDDRVIASFTLPASRGPQSRSGESLEPIFHTKENPGEDLSKDEVQFSNAVPAGLDEAPIPYNRRIMNAIYDILVAEKGEDIVVINIDGKTNWVPTMMIVTAMSSRHCVALASRVQAELKRQGLVKNAKIERNVGDEWVIVATGVAIVEIMTQESREHMDLERLWVLKKSAQETFEFDEEEERFMYDEEDGMWDDDDPDY